MWFRVAECVEGCCDGAVLFGERTGTLIHVTNRERDAVDCDAECGWDLLDEARCSS